MQWIPGADGTRESHVVDVHTGRGTTHGREVTVFGDRAAVTDAVATALTLVPPAQQEALVRRFGVRWVDGGTVR
jgi:thiamine biosynthesis lipoprotein ApbE